MSFSKHVQSTARSCLFYMANKFSTGFMSGEFPGQPSFDILYCRDIFHHFRYVTGGKVLLKDPGNIRIHFFSLWNNHSSKNVKILWLVHHSFGWLKSSHTAVIAASPKHLLCVCSHNDLNVNDESSLRMIFEHTDFSDPVQRNEFHRLKRLFSTDHFANVCTFLPTYIVFLSLLWLRAVFYWFCGVQSYCDDTSANCRRTDLDAILHQIILRGSFLLCRSKHHLF